jgi:hypothetical protein
LGRRSLSALEHFEAASEFRLVEAAGAEALPTIAAGLDAVGDVRSATITEHGALPGAAKKGRLCSS